MAIQMVMQLLEPAGADATPVRTEARAARSRKRKST